MSSTLTTSETSIPIKSGFKTSEWASVVGFLIQNLIMILVALGKMDTATADGLSAALTSFAGTVIVAVAEAAVLWKFIASRQDIKVAAIAAATQMPPPSDPIA